MSLPSRVSSFYTRALRRGGGPLNAGQNDIHDVNGDKGLFADKPSLLRASMSLQRQWLLIGAFGVFAVLLVLLPPMTSRWLFIITTTILVTYALNSAVVRDFFRTRFGGAVDGLPLGEASASSPAADGSLPMSLFRRLRLWGRAHRQELAFNMLLVTAVLLTLCTLAFRPSVPYERLWIAALLLIAGIGALNFTLWLSGEAALLPMPTAASWLPLRTHRYLLAIGALALLTVAEINGNVSLSGDVFAVSIHTQFLLLVGGTVTVAWALSGIRVPRLHFDWREGLLLLAITALAVALRLYHIDIGIQHPIHEDFYADFVNKVRENHYVYRLLIPIDMLAPQGLVYTYLQDLGARIFGNSMFGLRVSSGIVGAMTIPALYILARSLFDRRTAIVAALILATFPPHMQISRLGLPSIFDPVFGTFAVAFIARGLRTNHRADFAIGGAMLGLSQYFVDAGRVFFPMILILWLGAGMFLWRPRPSWRGLLIAGIAAFLVGAPQYYGFLGQGFPLFPRVDAVGTGYWQQLYNSVPFDAFLTELLRNISYSFLHYIHSPDIPMLWIYYGGTQPLIVMWIVPLFLMGFGYALWRWRRPAGALLALWLVMAPLGIGLVQGSGATIRFTVVFPALALALAVGCCYVLPLYFRGRVQRFQNIILGVVVVSLAIGQVVYYFADHLPTYNVQIRQALMSCGEATEASTRAASLPPRTQVFIISNGWPCDWHEQGSIMRFMRDDLTFSIGPREAITDDYLENRLPRNVDTAFFLWPNDTELRERIHNYFQVDDPQYSNSTNTDPRRTFVMYYIHAEPQFGPMRLVQR